MFREFSIKVYVVPVSIKIPFEIRLELLNFSISVNWNKQQISGNKILKTSVIRLNYFSAYIEKKRILILN